MTSEGAIIYIGIGVSQPTGARSAESARAKLEEAVLNALVECNEIHVPQAKVDNEVNGMVQELYQKLCYDSLATGTPHFFIHEEVEEQMDSIREEAYRQVKLDLLLKEIIKLEQLQVTQEELEAEALAMAQRQQIPVERIYDFFGRDLTLLNSDLLVRKAIDLVCEKAVVMYV